MIIFLLLALLQPPPPAPTAQPEPAVAFFAATWERPDRARLSWAGDAPVFCAGKYRDDAWIALGCSWDGFVFDHDPHPSDAYVLTAGRGVLARTQLAGRALVPLFIAGDN